MRTLELHDGVKGKEVLETDPDQSLLNGQTELKKVTVTITQRHNSQVTSSYKCCFVNEYIIYINIRGRTV